MNSLISRRDAVSTGLSLYFTGKPCPKGHVCERSVSGRVCIRCAKERSSSVSYCEQQRVRTAAWYAANREDVRRKQKEAYDADPQRALDRIAAFRKGRPNYIQECADYYLRNREAITARNKEYIAANPEVRRVIAQNRMARKRASGGKLSKGIIEKLQALQKGKCANCCSDLKKAGFHLDHILPIALGGPHVDANIQLLCPPCNLTKSAKHPIDWARQQGRLL